MGEKRQTGKLMGNDPVFGVYVLTLLVERFTVVEDIQWIERGQERGDRIELAPFKRCLFYSVGNSRFSDWKQREKRNAGERRV